MIAVAEPAGVSSTASASTEAQTIHDLQQTISASRLTLFLQCRLKFWFRYVAGITKPKTAALHVGTAVHAALKTWNKARWRGESLTLKQLHDHFAEAWSDQEEQPVAWEEDETEQKSMAWRLVETYLRESKFPPDVKPEAVEVPVEADLAPKGLPKLIGVLDLVQAQTIIDYKTSATTPNPEKVAHTNEVQACSYALLYRIATGNREAGIEFHSLVKLKNPRLVMTPLPPMSEQQLLRLLHLMEAYVLGLDRRDFIPSPGLQCASCEFFNECRAWH